MDRFVDPPIVVFTPDPLVVPIEAAESVCNILRVLGPAQTPEEQETRLQLLRGLFHGGPCIDAQRQARKP